MDERQKFYDAIQREILDLATEDRYGLWEIVGSIEQDHPELTSEEALSTAKEMVGSMLRAGLLGMEREHPSEHYVELEDQEALEISAKDHSWEIPKTGGRDPLYWVYATDAGRRAYHRK